MNWHHKCRLCLTDSPQRPIHALNFPELLTTLKDIFEIQILPDDNMDIVCATCMETISKVKFFKSNQNVIKECRGFCINLGIKLEKDDKDDDCILIENVENTEETVKVLSNVNTRKHTLASTIRTSPENQNESKLSASSNDDTPKMKKCKVLVTRLNLDNLSFYNKSGECYKKTTRNDNLEKLDSVTCKQDIEKSTIAIPPKKIENPTDIEQKITPSLLFSPLVNKQLSENSTITPSTSTLNSIPKNIKWIPVEFSQQSIHTDATSSTRLSFISNNNKCSPTIIKLPSTLKINQIPSTQSSISKVGFESLSKNNNISFNSMFNRTSAQPATTVEQPGFSNQAIKTSTERKVDSTPGISSISVLNQRHIKPIKIASPPIPPSAQPFERINLPMKSDSHSTIDRYRALNSKIILKNNSKVKVLSVNELNKKPEQRKLQLTAPSISSSAPPSGTLIGVVNPNNSIATELTVRFVRQSSKFCIIILLYGRIVTFGDLDSHQLQCLKRLLAKNLKTSMNTHRFLLTHTPDEETLKLLRVLHIDHLLKRSY